MMGGSQFSVGIYMMGGSKFSVGTYMMGGSHPPVKGWKNSLRAPTAKRIFILNKYKHFVVPTLTSKGTQRGPIFDTKGDLKGTFSNKKGHMLMGGPTTKML